MTFCTMTPRAFISMGCLFFNLLLISRSLPSPWSKRTITFYFHITLYSWYCEHSSSLKMWYWPLTPWLMIVSIVWVTVVLPCVLKGSAHSYNHSRIKSGKYLKKKELKKIPFMKKNFNRFYTEGTRYQKALNWFHHFLYVFGTLWFFSKWRH